jgi:3-hydroxyethyl bacteriochlorophyllide a dehydrogenase
VGRVAHAGLGSGRRAGERVFVPGARCFGETRGLFGGAAARLVVPGARVVSLPDALDDQGVLLALAATAYHAVAAPGAVLPALIVGHGALGRLLARLTIALGGAPPRVWETNPARQGGARGYPVCAPRADERRDYPAIYDASGDPALLDALVERLAPRGEIVLAGFYRDPLAFRFPPAFLREARFRVAAEWQPADLAGVAALVAAGALSLDTLITHRRAASDAAAAYATAFTDPACVKMVLDWRSAA